MQIADILTCTVNFHLFWVLPKQSMHLKKAQALLQCEVCIGRCQTLGSGTLPKSDSTRALSLHDPFATAVKPARHSRFSNIPD